MNERYHAGLPRKFKIEVEDSDGTKYTLSMDGRLSKEKVFQFLEMLEVMNVDFTDNLKLAHEGTFLSRVLEIIDECFPGREFSSSDVARELEEKYNIPVKLSTVSTYLSRLADNDYLKREKFGNSWVYKKNYLRSRASQ